MTAFQKQLEKNGATLIDIRPYSDHDGDSHLSIVLCRRATKHEPFVTWCWNGSSNGFCDGHYFQDIEEAAQDFFPHDSRGSDDYDEDKGY